PWSHPGRDVRAGYLAADGQHLAVGEAPAVAEGVDPVLARGAGGQGQQVRAGQVGDVDVVPDAGPVRGRVVVAEDLQFGGRGGRLGEGDLEDVRYQVGLGGVPLGEPAAAVGLIGAGHVEVPQAHPAQPVQRGVL